MNIMPIDYLGCFSLLTLKTYGCFVSWKISICVSNGPVDNTSFQRQTTAEENEQPETSRSSAGSRCQ